LPSRAFATLTATETIRKTQSGAATLRAITTVRTTGTLTQLVVPMCLLGTLSVAGSFGGALLVPGRFAAVLLVQDRLSGVLDIC